MNDPLDKAMARLTARYPEFAARLAREFERAPGNRLRACLAALAEAVRADGCTWYTLQGSELVFDIVLSRSLGLGGGYRSGSVDFPSIRMRRVDGSFDDSSLAVRAAHEKRTINVRNVREELGEAAARTQGFDRVMGYRTHSILTLPVILDGERVRGVLQLVNATDEQGRPAAFGAAQVELAEAAAEVLAVL